MKTGRHKGFLKGNNIRRKLGVILLRENGSIVGILCQIRLNLTGFIHGISKRSGGKPLCLRRIIVNITGILAVYDLLFPQSKSLIDTIRGNGAGSHFVADNMLRSSISQNTVHDIDQNDHEDDHTNIDIYRLAIFGYSRTLLTRTGARRRTFAVLDRLAGFLIVITAVGQKQIPRMHNESLGIISQGFPVIL